MQNQYLFNKTKKNTYLIVTKTFYLYLIKPDTDCKDLVALTMKYYNRNQVYLVCMR